MAGTDGNSSVVVPRPIGWHRRIFAEVVANAVRLCLLTWRVRWHDPDAYPETQGPVIFCVWHNRLAAALASYRQFAQARWTSKGLAGMVSASRDGSLLSTVLRRFDIQPIRGSTSRRGPQALLEATTWLERQFNIVITPDGPRGPVYQVQDGIIHLAQLTGRPIIPTSNFVRWKARLGSWDRFQIPLPFAHCDAYHAKPIWVPRNANEAECETLRAALQASMLAITKD
jgi:lysophospholipid acyltransferase (LPLAT)-like uncharacterized protein